MVSSTPPGSLTDSSDEKKEEKRHASVKPIVWARLTPHPSPTPSLAVSQSVSPVRFPFPGGSGQPGSLILHGEEPRTRARSSLQRLPRAAPVRRSRFVASFLSAGRINHPRDLQFATRQARGRGGAGRMSGNSASQCLIPCIRVSAVPEPNLVLALFFDDVDVAAAAANSRFPRHRRPWRRRRWLSFHFFFLFFFFIFILFYVYSSPRASPSDFGGGPAVVCRFNAHRAAVDGCVA